MVSKRILTSLIVVALLLAVISIVLNISVSSISNANLKKIPSAEINPTVNVIPDKEIGQVNLVINKPTNAP